MVEKEADSEVQHRDRRLGDEWADWKGEADPQDLEIDEKMTTFFFLAAGIMLLVVVLLPVVWYLIKPRIEQFDPHIANIVEWSVICSAGFFAVLIVLEGVSLMKLKRSLFPYKLMEKFLLSLLPKTVWLGRKFGISRDRVGNSFIKVHNFMTKSRGERLDLERLLILLPRCLKKEARRQIIERTGENGLKVLTASGGEEAREAIRQYRPTCILAFACERDLVSGIRDVAEKIPVLAIPNRRPEGPCKNTEVSLFELEEALRFITERRKRKSS